MSKQIDSELGWGVRWSAPAKLNLMLRIVGRREDGYHLLQTVFQIIDIDDGLVFHKTNDGRVRLQRAIPGIKEEDDLTVRAANMLKMRRVIKEVFVLILKKTCPWGAG